MTDSRASCGEAQAFSEDELILLDDAVGNHEAKTLVAGIFASHPDTAFVKSTLDHEVNSRQAFLVDKPPGMTYKQFIETTGGWMPHDGVARSYCVNTLEPIGMIVETPTVGKNGLEPGWRATELGRRCLAYIGANSDWSLRYPNKSVQKIRGITATQSGVRAPEVRQNIYQALIKADGKPVSYVDVTEQINRLGISRKLVGAVITDLVDLDILNVASKLDPDYNPSFIILDPTFSHVALEFNDLQIESQIMYRALGELYKQDEVSTLHDLLRTAERLRPSIDLHDIRRRFTMGISTATSNLPGIELAEGTMPPERRDEVRIATDYIEPIGDLLERRNNLKVPEAIVGYSDRAREVLETQTLFKRLMGKAALFSASRMAQLEKRSGLERQISTVLRGSGGLSARELRELLKARGRTVTVGAVQVVLSDLSDKQTVTIHTIQPNTSKRGVVNIYTLASDET